MNGATRGWLGLACALGLAVTTVLAETPPKPADQPKAPGPSKEAGKAPTRSLDASKLPPGAVIIIAEDGNDALQYPGAVVLTPEEYKKLLDQIDQLKRQITPDKPVPPSSCRLTGRLETTGIGDVVRIQAQFGFETDRPKMLIALGCQKAWPTAVSLDDGRTPLLPPPDEDGFVVQVDTPGKHRLTLDLEVPVTARGAERGFELNLPRAAITLLEAFDVPDAVKELRIGGRPTSIPSKELSSKSSPRQAVTLGAISRLDITWKGPAPVQLSDPLQAAQGQVMVRVEEKQVVIDADLTLRLLRGQANEWRIQAPPPPIATIEPKGQPQDQPAYHIDPPQDPENPVWRIRLDERTDKPLRINVHIQQPLPQPRTAKSVPIGPFTVLNAYGQQGTILINAPANVRLRYHPRGDLSQREVAEESFRDSNTVASFNYSSLPLPPKKDQAAAPPLDLDIEPVKGAVETHMIHKLWLTDLGWKVQYRIDVTPVRTTMERLEVELPSIYQDVTAKETVLIDGQPEIRELGPDRNVALIKLAQKQSRPYSVTLEALVPVKAGDERLSLGLPRPLDALDRGADVSAAVPEGLELAARQSGSEAPRPGPRPIVWHSDQAPVQVDLAWQRSRPDFPVDAEVDLALTERQARVRQRLRFPAHAAVMGSAKSQQVLLVRVPVTLADRLTVVEGYRLTPSSKSVWTITMPEPAEKEPGTRKEQIVTLEYSFALPVADKDARSRRFLVPLVWADQATRGTTKVRVWTEPGSRPALVGGPWEELPIEVAPERTDRLPALVVRTQTLESPLTLSLTEAALAPLATIVVDRALLRARVDEAGFQTYRARFLIRKLITRTIDVELPAPPASLNLELALDGQRVDDIQVVDENGRVVRLKVEPDLYQKPVVLDLHYHLVPGREASSKWLTTFQPPLLRGNVFLWRVRWQVDLPANELPLYPGDGITVEQRWGLRGWLPAPRAAVSTADLERWFHADLGTTPSEEEMEPAVTPSLVGWQTSLKPLRLIHLPQQVWLVACSLLVVMVGLGLLYTPLSRGQFWLTVAALSLIVLAAGLWWPSVLPAFAYGGELGAAVLILVVVVQWMLQRRYRRQVVFMPGFTRLKPGSSLIRGGPGSHRGRREPSTVDAPPQSSAS